MTANNEDNSQPPASPSESKPLSTDTPPPNSSSELASSSSSSPSPPTPDRSELLVRARHFLSSPQVIDQDYESKRRFLAEKGLTDGEMQLLLREMSPVVPPRMYPTPPPSRLPGLLVGTFKVLSWLAGGSTALLFIYYRLLLPRLTQSALARRSLKAHQSDLLAKLTTSLHDFKGAQEVAYADLPHPDPWEEVVPWCECKSLSDVASAVESGSTHPPHVTLLRCALADLAVQNKPSTADDIFQILFSTNLPSLLNIDNAYQESLWITLSDAPLFHCTETSSSESPPALSKLQNSVTHAVSERPTHRFQHTLQALIDFTGYLTTKTYALASAMHRLPGVTPSPATTGIEEEEIRMEIKALKGLVLNRRTFIPATAIARPLSAPIDKAP
ncbi:hypothetical protein F5888DRAFT_1791867 [Russula emetica]|nr:hypothetical protein F5888DRAFT_1791867 [Russula emetica]